MNTLIKLSETLYVNPDKVSAVEKMERSDGLSECIVYAGKFEFSVISDFVELVAKIGKGMLKQ